MSSQPSSASNRDVETNRDFLGGADLPALTVGLTSSPVGSQREDGGSTSLDDAETSIPPDQAPHAREVHLSSGGRQHANRLARQEQERSPPLPNNFRYAMIRRLDQGYPP